MRLLESIGQDIRYALRMMRSTPGLTAVAILSLALGIGATTAIFCVMNALMLKPLPVKAPNQLVQLERHGGQGLRSYPMWRQIQDQQDIFSGVLGYTHITFHLADGEEIHSVPGLFVTGNYFNTLGVSAILGRTFTDSDDKPKAAPVCVISYGLWQRKYGKSRSVIGQTLLLDGHVFEVVGVAPRSFFGVEVGETFEVIAPLEIQRILLDQSSPVGRSSDWLPGMSSYVGRLKQGIGIRQANARLQVLSAVIYKNAILPDDGERAGQLSQPLNFVARPMWNGISYMRYVYGNTVLLMMVMVGVVLIIACTNLANLLLARSTRRQREIATRLALGASRWRLVRQLLTESIALSLIGAALGLIIAHWGSKALVSAFPWPNEPNLDLSWDPRLVAFTTTTTFLCAFLFGLAPALRATCLPLYSAMKGGSAFQKGRHRFSGSLLIVTQVTLSIVLLIGAGLLVRTLQALMAKDLGYDPKGILVVNTDWAGRGDNSERQAFVGDQLLAEFRSVPGVVSAARTTSPASRTSPTAIIQMPDGTENRYPSFLIFASPGFFKTRRTPMLNGRDFDPGDTKTSPAVAILSERTAQMFFPGVNPLGLRYRQLQRESNAQEESVEIVGIAKNISYQRPSDGPLPIVYRPTSQCTDSCPIGTYELRFTGPLPEIRERVKTSAANIDFHLVLDFSLLSDDANELIQINRVTAIITTFFGLLTVMLAVIGIYGVTSYATSQRTHEIGIRMALGAQPSNVLRMIVGEAITVVFAGVALGVMAGFAAAKTIQGMLFGVTPADPFTFTFAACLMLSVAAIAAFLPAYRASKADPIVALRFE